MHIVKFEIFRFPIASDQIHHHIRVLDGRLDRTHVTNVIEMEHCLAQIADQSQAQRFVVIGTVRKDELRSDLAEFIGHIAANESGTSENGHNHSVEAGPSAGAAFQRRQIGRFQRSRLCITAGIMRFHTYDAQRSGVLFCVMRAGLSLFILLFVAPSHITKQMLDRIT